MPPASFFVTWRTSFESLPTGLLKRADCPKEDRRIPLLDVQSVNKSYRSAGGTLDVLSDITLSVAAGEFVTLVGPSGCGKSTLLSIIAGLEEPSSGSITLNGQVNTRRLGQVGYMPQRDLLLPWRSALDNAIAGLEIQGVSRRAARRQAQALFAEFGLAGFSRSYPFELSGGMRQRVAFARTVLAGGNLVLLDEPFGALDALTRAALQRWLLGIWGQLGMACLFVTHDIDEALLLADRVYGLSPRPGRVRIERRIPLPRPRTPGMLSLVPLLEVKRELAAALAEGGSLNDVRQGT
jgi:ABC-type nitrate/sulfonate/bicarbonate transport system ATPase subunit